MNYSPAFGGFQQAAVDPKHLEEWRNSGVSDEIAYANVRSYSGQTALQLVTEDAIAQAQSQHSYVGVEARRILGCVDNSAKFNQQGSQINKAQKILRFLLKTGKDAAKVLELVEPAFNQMPLFVQMSIQFSGVLAI